MRENGQATALITRMLAREDTIQREGGSLVAEAQNATRIAGRSTRDFLVNGRRLRVNKIWARWPKKHLEIGDEQ